MLQWVEVGWTDDNGRTSNSELNQVALLTYVHRVENGTAAFGRLLKTHLFSEY